MKIKSNHDISDIIENFKIKLKYFLKVSMWVFMVLVIIYGVFKIIKWGEIFNKNYVEYVNKKEEIILPTTIGGRVLSYEDKLWLSLFVNKLKKIDLETLEIKTSTTSNQIIFNVSQDVKSKARVNIQKMSNFDIKLKIKDNLENAWVNFVSVYMSNELESLIKKGKKLEYIDLRFDAKVFYKLKEDYSAVAATSTEAI